MSSITLNAQVADEVGHDVDATFRKDFLNTVSCFGVGQDQMVALVEASSGRPFAACLVADLMPILCELLALARSIRRSVGMRSACDV